MLHSRPSTLQTFAHINDIIQTRFQTQKNSHAKSHATDCKCKHPDSH